MTRTRVAPVHAVASLGVVVLTCLLRCTLAHAEPCTGVGCFDPGLALTSSPFRPAFSRYHLVLRQAELRLASTWLHTNTQSVPATTLRLGEATARRFCEPLARGCLGSRRNAEPPEPPEPSLRNRWQLGRGRELTVNLTPTPRNCAPLVRMTF